MKNAKKYIFFFLIFALALAQLIASYSEASRVFYFYPNWSVGRDNQTVSITGSKGFFAQVATSDPGGWINLEKQSNSLVVNQSFDATGSLVNYVEQQVKYCDNCYIIDLNHNEVFTDRDPETDLVLKKRVLNAGYSLNLTKTVDLGQNTVNLAIYSPLSEDLVTIETANITVAHIDDNSKTLTLEVRAEKKGKVLHGQQRFIFQ